MRISDWSSDVCSSDLLAEIQGKDKQAGVAALLLNARVGAGCIAGRFHGPAQFLLAEIGNRPSSRFLAHKLLDIAPECFKRRHDTSRRLAGGRDVSGNRARHGFNGSLVVSPVLARSEEHTSELQSLMRISYAVFCLKKKNKKQTAKRAKEQK